MVRVRFAPSPTGSLHLGGALTAVANRRFADEHGGVLVLRVDDTDVARAVPGSEEEIRSDLDWLGVAWDEGPVRQSERAERHLEAAREIGSPDAEGALRFGRATIVRADGRPTYQLASVVDDLDLGITHVIRGKDLLPSTELQVAIARALGAEPPEYLHHGLLVGEDGRKLSKREQAASVAGLRELGIPPEAVRAYLEELDLPRGDVHFDEARLRRLAVEALGTLSDEELAARAGAEPRYGPALRGARDLAEARATAEQLAHRPEPGPSASPETLSRFLELREAAPDDLDKAGAKAIVRELKAVGGDLRALRLALTGTERGPELWAVLVALTRDEALARCG
ncbi:MAG TPA: glutamate--tRNA ligase family protein [Gaiellaceae bacterium]|nr:glutamate--tRNA ligase family protein [Gaiellaceae bacterium]